MNTVTVETPISNYQISSLLCCAFEGGVGYWCRIEDYEFPEGITRQDFQEGGRFTDPKTYWHPSQIVPLHEGCTVVLTDIIQTEDRDGEIVPRTYRLDREAVTKGLQLLAAEYPRHYSDFISERYDADTGDVFLQCCVLGRVTYG